jgi:hypothetical protein
MRLAPEKSALITRMQKVKKLRLGDFRSPRLLIRNAAWRSYEMLRIVSSRCAGQAALTEEIVQSARYTDPSDIGARRGAVPGVGTGAGAIVSTVDRGLSLLVLRQCRMVQLQVGVVLVLIAIQQSQKT